MNGSLSRTDIAEIRERAPKECYSQIARQYGVSRHIIKEIIRSGRREQELREGKR